MPSKLRDREMLQGLIDMSGLRPSGEPLRPITEKAQELVPNRQERRAKASNARRKKNKFARS